MNSRRFLCRRVRISVCEADPTYGQVDHRDRNDVALQAPNGLAASTKSFFLRWGLPGHGSTQWVCVHDAALVPLVVQTTGQLQ
jgi:hypothetical protein